MVKVFKNAGDLQLGNDFDIQYIKEDTYIQFDNYYKQRVPYTGLHPDFDELKKNYEEYTYIVAYSQIENIPIHAYSIYFQEADGSKLMRPDWRFPPPSEDDYVIFCESQVDCSIDRTGKILNINVSNNIAVGDKVRDNPNILDINSVLQVIIEKFEKTNTHMTIHKIDLAYDGILSDELDEQGRREEYLEPIWTVKYLIDGSYEQKIGINAITGEVYERYCGN